MKMSMAAYSRSGHVWIEIWLSANTQMSAGIFDAVALDEMVFGDRGIAVLDLERTFVRRTLESFADRHPAFAIDHFQIAHRRFVRHSLPTPFL